MQYWIHIYSIENIVQNAICYALVESWESLAVKVMAFDSRSQTYIWLDLWFCMSLPIKVFLWRCFTKSGISLKTGVQPIPYFLGQGVNCVEAAGSREAIRADDCIFMLLGLLHHLNHSSLLISLLWFLSLFCYAYCFYIFIELLRFFIFV